MKEWGLENVRLEKWATPKDNPIPSWQLLGYSGAMVEPVYMPIVGIPLAWTAGTNGPVTAEAMLAPIQSLADMEKYRGKLAGKIVLIAPPPELALPTTPLAARFTPEQLADLATELIPATAGPAPGGRGPAGNMTPEQFREYQQKLRTYWKEEKVVATLNATERGQSGTLFGGGAPNRADLANPPQVSVTAEHYNRIARLVQHKVPVKLMFDIKTQFDTGGTESFNVIGEIRGTTKPMRW